MPNLQNAIKKAVEGLERPFAVFDFDNTCIAGDIGEATLSYLCRNKLLKDKTLLPEGEGDYHEWVLRHYYELLDAGDMVAVYLFCARVCSGFTPAEIDALVSATIDAEGSEVGTTELYGLQVIKGLAARPATQELIAFLQREQVDIWIVSASAEVVVKTAMQRFNIPGKRIGLRNAVIDGTITKEIIEPYSIAAGKVDCIKTYIDKEARPVFGIGDSMNDLPMIEYSAVRAVVDRGNALAKEARARGWFTL